MLSLLLKKRSIESDNNELDLSNIIGSLVSDEIIAWWMYWFMYQVSQGNSYHSMAMEFEEHAKEELEHANKLITWAQANNVNIPVMPDQLFSIANNPMFKFRCGECTAKFIEKNIMAERGAIKSYREKYKLVHEEYPDLGQLFMEISNEEQDHLNDLLDLGSQVGIDSMIMDGTSLSGVSEYPKYKESTNNLIDKIMDTSNFTERLKRINNVINFSEKINKDELFSYAHTLAKEIFKDKVDDKIVSDIVENAINKSNGDMSKAMGIIKNSYT